MKMLVLSQYWHPENGVPQRRWTWLTKLLQNAGHEVLVVAPPPHYKRSISMATWLRDGGLIPALHEETGPNGERILRSGYFPSGRSLARRILNQGWTAMAMILAVMSNREVKNFHPDIVLGTVPALPTSVVAFIAAKRLRVPYVIDLRDAWPALFRESSEWDAGTSSEPKRKSVLLRVPFQLLLRFSETALNAVLRRASGIITTSSNLERELRTAMDKPTATVRNVFPSAVFPDVGRERALRAKRGEANTLNVLYAGTLGRAQKLENALIAAQHAQAQGVRICLRFVGEGATFDALKQAAVRYGVDLDLQHQHEPNDLREYYAWADTALVHLTDWESLKVAVPSKTYELMVNGIHISAVIAGETEQIIRTLHAGHVVAPSDPQALADLWIELVRNPQQLEVTREGKQWVEYQRDTVAPAALLGFFERVRQLT